MEVAMVEAVLVSRYDQISSVSKSCYYRLVNVLRSNSAFFIFAVLVV